MIGLRLTHTSHDSYKVQSTGKGYNMTKLDTGRVGIKPPEIPSKWDIIPIHTSDRGTFKACRRRWAWSSPSRDNIISKVQVHGVTVPLWFGTGIHYALEKYYNPSLREDPETVWA